MDENLNESPFDQIASTLKKYGSKSNVDNQTTKKPTRSKWASNMTMTGHKEVEKDGRRIYTKVLSDDEGGNKVHQNDTPKRKRGRPAGSYGSYKARSAETAARAAAKSAATKAANKANKAQLTKESLEEIFASTEFDVKHLATFLMSEDIQSLDKATKEVIASFVTELVQKVNQGEKE